MNDAESVTIGGRPGDEGYILSVYSSGKVFQYRMDEERLLWLLHSVSERILERKLKTNLTET